MPNVSCCKDHLSIPCYGDGSNTKPQCFAVSRGLVRGRHVTADNDQLRSCPPNRSGNLAPFENNCQL